MADKELFWAAVIGKLSEADARMVLSRAEIMVNVKGAWFLVTLDGLRDVKGFKTPFPAPSDVERVKLVQSGESKASQYQVDAASLPPEPGTQAPRVMHPPDYVPPSQVGLSEVATVTQADLLAAGKVAPPTEKPVVQQMPGLGTARVE